MFSTEKSVFSLRGGMAVLAIAASAIVLPLPAFSQVSGAIYTTDVACSGTDLNIYSSKDAVYLNGGPRHLGAAGLPDGEYYVQVTVPDGTLLGTSLGMLDETPVSVASGMFTACPKLSDILKKASDGTAGYDTTTNGGGEYKVWVSQVSTFNNSDTKTDNFKVKESSIPPSTATLVVQKFYDANASGTKDGTETFIIDWKVNIGGCINEDKYTEVNEVIDPGTCVVKEYMPTQTNWYRTRPAGTDTITLTIPANGTGTALFGNVCTGPGGGKTLGFWSNKNGQALITGIPASLSMVDGLNLVDANGANADLSSYTKFRTWILGASATNMSYMLSAQLAAMELNVYFNKVDPNAMIYAPGTGSANGSGFASVQDVMDEANTALGNDGYTLSGDPNRTLQQALKNALDNANNNLNFAQGSPCAFSF